MPTRPPSDEQFRAADDVVAVLRAAAGHDPYDRDLSDLVGELSTQSKEFRVRWARHDVRQHITGVKQFHHPVVGDLDLTYDRLDLAADPGLTLFTNTAEPRSRDDETLKLLGSWAATQAEADVAPAMNRTRLWTSSRSAIDQRAIASPRSQTTTREP